MKHVITIFDGELVPQKVELLFSRNELCFGRNERNDIVIQSSLVSGMHGTFLCEQDSIYIVDNDSTNGTYVNGKRVQKHLLQDGDIIKIDDMKNPLQKGVSILYEVVTAEVEWENFLYDGKKEITIGRDRGCDIVLNHISVSKVHARIQKRGEQFFLTDNHSFSGTSVNGRMVRGKVQLHEKDYIAISNTKFIFSHARISYCQSDKGMDIKADRISRVVKERNRSITITNNISVDIKPAEFVCIIGGSGAGKTTFMNAISGYVKATDGNVYVNGLDLYTDYEIVKNVIGYVPQQDIVYDNLTLYSMLDYVAQLKMPPDVAEEERNKQIKKVLKMVELEGKEDTFIYSLSGGQKKRASIAVELLSDPSLFFLDEPTSGLDPGTEKHMMQMLQKLSRLGKTVIMVTHNITNIDLCDRVIVLGKGGNLCFSGSPKEARNFFDISYIEDLYDKVTEDSEFWKRKFLASRDSNEKREKTTAIHSQKANKSAIRQSRVLCKRYAKLILNDRQRLMLLIFQAPLLAVLIYIVTNGQQYKEYEVTKSILFALSCSAFWIGILNSIQEICKEKNILKREYMSGVHMRAYVLSKYIVLSLLCAVQSLLLVGSYSLLVGMPKEGVFMGVFVELWITTFLTAVSAASLGLFVSCLFNNSDRAMTVAPILLMPQILFSGLVFDLNGVKDKISYAVNCRWSMEGYGTIANLNQLDLKLKSKIPQLEHAPEKMFEYTTNHLWSSWIMLILFIILFSIFCLLTLEYKEQKL